jgi:hypothetical protein
MFNILCRILGIPVERVVDFKISFWSGAIYTLLISFLVGIYLSYLEKRYDKRNEKRLNDREILVLVNKIRTIGKQPNIIHISPEAIKWVSTNLLDCIELISSSPIHIWKSNISTHYRNLLIHLENLYNSYEDFLVKSKELDLLLYQVGIKNQGDKVIILGIFNKEADYVRRIKNAPSHEFPLPTYEAYTKIMDNQQIVVNDYLNNKVKVINDYQVLQEQIKSLW